MTRLPELPALLRCYHCWNNDNARFVMRLGDEVELSNLLQFFAAQFLV